MGKKVGTVITAFHEALIREYVICKRPGDAYRAAGGTGKDPDKLGWAVLQLPQVKREVDRLLDEQNLERVRRAEQAGVTSEYLTKQFIVILDRSMQALPVVDKFGKPIPGQWQFDGANANRAAENLAKHIGYFPKEHPEQPTGNTYNNVTVQVLNARFTVDELRALVGKAQLVGSK